MTQEQLLQSREKAIQEYEQEIIELKNMNDYLDERLKAERSYSRELNDGNYNIRQTRDSLATSTFFMGLIVGVIVTIAIIALI